MIGRSVIVPFRWIFLALLSALIGALPFADATRAAEPQVPVLWDAKERLPKPDLSALPRLRFLTTTDFPPFNFLDGSGRLSGFHIDLARAICAELGIVEKCQIQALPWNDLDDALRKGEGEAIIAGIAATPESREKYAFSRSYLQFPARFIMPKAKAFTEPILDKLRSKRVGVIAGSAHEKMLRDYFSTVQVVPFDKAEDLYADLKAGRIDAAFGDGMRCRFAGGPYLAPEYLGSGMAIATRAGDPALAAAFDYALQEISIKGTFAEFYLRYFPVSFF
ncbi:MAG: transporter substrate-binding domain-containing protein [Mesorhizobium sp.]|uniref:transporter substrate-binding domain-containing protein n=1 Tax=Mesorhizobium sp. TaxID=1871066 RepID=UPI000FE9AD02|nr:transporter substrate-binding domain-containing protein [Mesorhizobium sp.]RWH02812.1 MAG: transporter substrate-binding domain-containing protein [Mesorhizobium sp.]